MRLKTSSASAGAAKAVLTQFERRAFIGQADEIARHSRDVNCAFAFPKRPAPSAATRFSVWEFILRDCDGFRRKVFEFRHSHAVLPVAKAIAEST